MSARRAARGPRAAARAHAKRARTARTGRTTACGRCGGLLGPEARSMRHGSERLDACPDCWLVLLEMFAEEGFDLTPFADYGQIVLVDAPDSLAPRPGIN